MLLVDDYALVGLGTADCLNGRQLAASRTGVHACVGRRDRGSIQLQLSLEALGGGGRGMHHAGG